MQDQKSPPKEIKGVVPTVAKPENLGWELLIILISVAVGIVLWKTQAIAGVLGLAGEVDVLVSFLAGVFFASIFTVVPATVVIVEMAGHYSLFWLAFFGGLGALCGDYIIFRFVRDRVSDSLITLLRRHSSERWLAIFHLRLFRHLMPLIGAIIIASPLPDELGLTIWGLSKLPTKYFVPLSFSLNALGILVIGLIARAAG
ncbi:MAG: hypothetical protein AAB686_00775 [Patescibacteria group bacterium]